MNVEISTETTKRIAEAIGKADPSLINKIVERVSYDKELLVGLASETMPAADVAAIREAIAQYNSGLTQAFEEVDAEIREQFGFAPPA